MLRKLGLVISYFIAIVYILLILLPLLYCFTVTSISGARDRVRAMVLCRPSCSLRLPRSLRLSHCTMPSNTSEKDNRGPGFSGLWLLFFPLFSSV